MRTVFLIGVTAFWLFTMNGFIQKEYFQVSLTRIAQEWAPITTGSVRENYQGIYLGAERIGFEYNALSKPESRLEGAFLLQHNSYLTFRILGEPREMLARGRAWLDKDLHLKKFITHISAQDYTTKMEGEVKGNELHILIQQQDGVPAQKILSLEEPVLHSECFYQIWTPSMLRPGRQGNLRVFNPLAMAISLVRFQVEREETLDFQGEKVKAFLVTLGTDDIPTKLWVNSDGLVLRKEVPNGLVMKNEPGWEIFKNLSNTLKTPPDLPNLYSIPTDKTIQKPRELTHMSAKVKGPNGEKSYHFTRQNPEPLKQLRLQDLQNLPTEALKAAPFMPVDDPDIQKLSREITGAESSVLSAALKIQSWVHRELTPAPTPAMADARQILKIKKGDCNEYTILFTTLARAAGIPTQPVAGLVYANGRFFYHAWAAIYLNQWIYMDPTFNQMPVDATHIPLVLGNIEKQAALADKIGRLKVTILSTSERDLTAAPEEILSSNQTEGTSERDLNVAPERVLSSNRIEGTSEESSVP